MMLNLNIIRNSISRTLNVRLLSITATKLESVETGITRDRSEEIPVETSIKYLKSAAYQKTYGPDPVWVQYRRNHKGSIPPRKTRRTCIRAKQITTGHPCPICRDEYLVLHEENTQLLNQFICPHTQSVLSYTKTGLCQKRHQELLVAVKRARDRGLLIFDIPIRKYNYSEYYNTNKTE